MISISNGRATFFLAKDWRSQLKNSSALDSQVPLCSGQSAKTQRNRLAREFCEHSRKSDYFTCTKMSRERKESLSREGGGAPMPTSPDRGASYSRPIWPQNYPRFFSFSGDRLLPDKNWLAYRPVPGPPKITRTDGSWANTPSVVTRPV